MNGSPAFTRSTRPLAHGASGSKSAPSTPATSGLRRTTTISCCARRRVAPPLSRTGVSASAPPNYLRTLPAEIASSAINYGLERVRRDQHQLFVEDTAPWTVHAVTSP